MADGHVHNRAKHVLEAGMKIAITLLLSSLCAFAGVTLTWDASPTPNVTYRLSGGIASSTNIINVNVGTNQQVTLGDFIPGTWSFQVYARDTNQMVESEPSNTVTFTIPEPPTNLRTLFIEGAIDLTGSGWTNLGFFRLRLQ